MLDIFLVATGIVLIIASYVISEKADSKKENHPEVSKVDIWTQKDEERVKERIDSILTEKMEEITGKTEEQLSQLSNEKIIAVSEFSDQVLDKISQNHTEVIFLYDMLNEKDTELKKMLQDVDLARTRIETAIKNASEEWKNLRKEEKKKPQIPEKSRPKTAVEMLAESSKAKKTEAEPVKKEKSEKVVKKMPVVKEKPAEDAVPENRNDKILELYREGKTILDIAKLLGLGQGEVKLVIDLYQGSGNRV